MLHRPVAEMLRAREAAHSGHELRLHPLSSRQPKSAEGTLANLDAFEVSP